MKVQIVRSSDVAACPKHSLSPAHYYGDGTCRCSERHDAQTAVLAAEEDVHVAKQALADARNWLRNT